VRCGRAVPVLTLALAVVATACERGLPPTLVVEDVVADLARDGADRSRAWTSLDPGDALRADGARDSLVMPPGGTTTWRIAVPDAAALRFGVGVEGAGKRDDSRAGLRFTVAIDGASAFAREVNPATARADRRWFDERIDLTPWKGRTIDVTFAVAAVGSGDIAGPAGWSRVRVVRETTVPRQVATAERPNVVVVVVDTLRADAVGPHGGGPSLTPRLDAFGAGGLVFAQAVSQSSWTLESVSSLMTGLHSRAHGARGRHDKNAGAEWGVLGDGAVTWAELAAHAGITPVGVSANPLVSRGTNLAQGFETFVELPWNPEGRDWPDGDAVNGAFFDWLDTHGGRRFVAYLHYMEPHDPYTPDDPPDAGAGLRPAIAKGWIRDAATQINWSHAAPLSAEEIAHLRDRYRGEVAEWDEAFGGLVDLLMSSHLLDRTVIVVTADHGEEFQEHGRLTHGSHLYEETVRVPLVLRGPGIPVGRRDDPVQGIDLFPTLARILGVTAPPGLGGHDLLAAGDDTRPAVLETSSGIGPDGAPLDLVAVRTARWKLVETPALDRRELYDLSADPGERNDRAASAPEAAELGTALARWRDTTRTASADTVAPGVHERLRALGYAQ
jgi:arylsulfatase A-like enzyme